MTFIVGIVGKPSSGKSTFLNAACLTSAEVNELPFTTINANKGIGYVKIKCACQELDLIDNPKNSLCINGYRFIPINILDVAGLVPGAHKGRGQGNQFLNDLSRADVLLHIVDITGALDKNGQRIGEGGNDPIEDIKFLEEEIDLWFKSILEREDWDRFQKVITKERNKFIEKLHDRLSGLKISIRQIINVLKQLGLYNKNPSRWNKEDILNFSKNLRKISKPIIIVANKIDKKIGQENYEKLKTSLGERIFPCSALAEYVMRKYNEEKIIEYIPGNSSFEIIKQDLLNNRELETLKKINQEILKKYNGTGVQEVLNHVVFATSDQICVYPVSDVNNMADKDNNVLPDVFLIKKGTKLKDFVEKKIHSDLAKHFIYGIDAKTKKRLSDDYILKNNDIVKIVAAK